MFKTVIAYYNSRGGFKSGTSIENVNFIYNKNKLIWQFWHFFLVKSNKLALSVLSVLWIYPMCSLSIEGKSKSTFGL